MRRALALTRRGTKDLVDLEAKKQLATGQWLAQLPSVQLHHGARASFVPADRGESYDSNYRPGSGHRRTLRHKTRTVYSAIDRHRALERILPLLDNGHVYPVLFDTFCLRLRDHKPSFCPAARTGYSDSQIFVTVSPLDGTEAVN